MAFAKIRLSLLVVFSAMIGYLAAGTEFRWFELVAVCLGGMLITASSNGINQVMEKEQDRQMSRTSQRPLPKENMTVQEGIVLSVVLGLGGLALLWFGTNPFCTMMSLGALVLYSFVYTPLKKVTSLAVFVGAFPGALPPLLGWVAATGEISYEALLIFAIQFMWQFPHFWAIAWRLDDDYKKAGYIMLPFSNGRSKANAFQILLYTLMMVPVSMFPLAFGYINWISSATIILLTILFCIPAVMLYRTLDIKWATQLMFSSFIYLPVVQLLILFNL